jgi:hypothetical protein
MAAAAAAVAAVAAAKQAAQPDLVVVARAVQVRQAQTMVLRGELVRLIAAAVAVAAAVMVALVALEDPVL